MKKRIISVIVLLAVMGFCVFFSEFTRVLFFAICGALCAYEYIQRLKEKSIHVTQWVIYSYIAVQMFLAVTHCGRTAYIAWFTVAIYIALTSGVLHKNVGGFGAVVTVSVLAYPCFPFALLMIISTSERVWPALALGCIPCMICDTFALLGGMLYGKHKVAPSVSPKKTIEGCLTGAVFATLSGIGIYYILSRSVPLSICMITAFVASTAGQIGDLSESLVKRFLEIKDFSDLIPGHGGMFDRADSMMFAIPASYLCLYLFGL